MAIREKFVVPIYNFEMWLIVNSDLKKAIDKVPVMLKHKYDEGDENCQGVAYCAYPFYCICLQDVNLKAGIIQHEIGHVTRQMMEDIGFTISADNDEPLAWLEDWVADKVAECLSSS